MSGKKKSGYDGKIAGLYDLEETIGQGHFAIVKLARHVFTGEKVAVKVIDKQKLDDISRSHLFQEVRCMKLVQHPNVVRLYEVIDTQTKLYLILELGDGDMYDYIMKHDSGLDEVLAKKYFRQIVEAIIYCHKLHVVHRDLKPENVVFFNDLGVVKLTDFGFSNVFAPGKKLETSCGSLAYSAPEILLGDSYDPPAVDVWSLGVILFMLVAGHAPFQEANDSETLTMIMDCKYQIPSHVSLPCHRLISKMLVREPSHRLRLEDIEQDPWLASDGTSEEVLRTNLPLLSREQVSEEDHTYVVQKMVEGKICTREEIFHSLELDAYDHIAATYYLLVERRLRKRQQQEAAASQTMNLRKQSAPSTHQSHLGSGGKPHLEPLMLSPRKPKEVKKTKTAPINKSGAAPPALVITPPVSGESSSLMKLPVSPGGPEYVKSLTTSMTLDRRNGSRKKNEHQPPGKTCACPLQNVGVPLLPPKGHVRKDKQRVKSAPLSSGDGGLASTVKKKSSGPSFSKIAILSSFFERRAAQEAGTIAPQRPHQRLLPWMAVTRDRKNQPHKTEIPDPSSLVQSLVSPLAAYASPASTSTSPKMAHLSPEAMFVAGSRKCSLIQEESHDDDEDDDLDDLEMDSNELKPSKSLEFLDDRSCEMSLSHSQDSILTPLTPVKGESNILDSVNARRPLKSVCSSPQLLNQIHEENESEGEDDFVPLKLSAPPGRYNHSGAASPEILRKYEQRRRRKGAGQRGTSCSSSDASDTDDTEGRSRKEKLKHKFMHRRDSSDHSSDTDGPSGGNNIGGGGRIGNGGGGAKTSHRSSRRSDGSNGGGSGGGGGGGGGSANDKSGGGKNHACQNFPSSNDRLCNGDPLKGIRKNNFDNPPVVTNQKNMGSNYKSTECSKNAQNCALNHQAITGLKNKKNKLGVINTDLGGLDIMVLSHKLSAINNALPLSSSSNNVLMKSKSKGNNSNILSNRLSNGKKFTDSLVAANFTSGPVFSYIGQSVQEVGCAQKSKAVEFTRISTVESPDDASEEPELKSSIGCDGLVLPPPTIASVEDYGRVITSTVLTVDRDGQRVGVVESKCCSVV